MLRLAKAFWDIALWRRSPAQLPSSLFLLCLVAGASVLLELVEGLLPPRSLDHLLPNVVLGVGLPLAFAWAVLSATRRRQRFLQTGSALLGVAVVAELVLYPLSLLFAAVGDAKLLSIPLGCLLFAGLVWYLLACANIWRAALDAGLSVGVAISAGYLLLSMILQQQLLPDA